MPKISFKKDFDTIEVFSFSDSKKTLMQILLDNDMPVASSCQGEGVCGKCKVLVLSENQPLPPPNEAEIRIINKENLSSEIRLSCQIFVTNDIQIDTDYW